MIVTLYDNSRVVADQLAVHVEDVEGVFGVLEDMGAWIVGPGCKGALMTVVSKCNLWDISPEILQKKSEIIKRSKGGYCSVHTWPSVR